MAAERGRGSADSFLRMRIEPLGDRAFLVHFADDGVSPASPFCLAGDALRELPWVTDVVSGLASLAVHVDPRRVAPDEAAEVVVERLLTMPDLPAAASHVVEIPVTYDGPDLEAVAAHCGLEPDEVVRRHVAPVYEVRMIGFMPGFPYLARLDEMLHTPRLETPRPRVPAGSVGIGGAQTGIYPFESPGGWRLIGRTDTVLFDAAREPASLLAVGDRVRFVERR